MEESIGSYLKKLREEAGLSLRAVETRCGVSNGYLSLLENDRIKEPSPKILWALAQLYHGDYVKLMRLAGYPVPAAAESTRLAFTFRVVDRLVEEDRQDIQAITKRSRAGIGRAD